MPKRKRSIYYKCITFTEILNAHKRARKGKRYKNEVILFEQKLEENIFKIAKELKNITYKPGKYKEFKVYEPKERIIKALPYKDRVIHQWYVENFLKPVFVKSFTKDTYACIEGRGTHQSAKQLQQYMREAKRSFGGDYWILKFDVKKYFFNINKDILYKIISHRIADKAFLKLTQTIIYDTPDKVGIPIGNYTSQYFANIYLSQMDEYIKKELKIKYYVRYMDDGVLILKTKEEAIETLNNLKIYLNKSLELEFNSKTNYFPMKQGANFCGYRIWATHMILREQSKKSIKRKMKSFQKMYKEGKIEIKDITRCVMSWCGHVKHCNSYRLICKIFYKYRFNRS